MGLKINFPTYFDANEKFNARTSNSAKFVRYAHTLDNIVNVQLGIEETFLVYVLKGQAIFKGSHGVIDVNAHEAALISKGAYIMSETLSPSPRQFNAILFFPSEEIIFKICAQFEKQTNLSKFIKTDYHNFCKIELDNLFHTFMESVEGLLKLPTQEQALIENICALKCEELIYYLLKSPQKEIVYSIFLDKSDDKTLKIRTVVERYYLEDLSIKELAFMSCMSLSSFKRHFFEIYQESPGRWILDKRLTYAKNLITTSSLPIADIAEKCCFSSLSYFASSIKKKYGMSPIQMRNKRLFTTT